MNDTPKSSLATTRKIAIASAANELCRDASLHNISIDAICKQAGVSKSSFYRLFADKYDIVFWALSVPAIRGVGQTGRTLTCYEGVRYTLDGLFAFQNLCHPKNSPQKVPLPADLVGSLVEGMIQETVTGFHGAELDRELAFQIRWNSAAVIKLIGEWLADENADVAEIARCVVECCPSRLRLLLDNPVDPKPAVRFDLRELALFGDC